MSDSENRRSRAETALLGALARFRSDGKVESGVDALLLRAAAAETAPRRRDEAIEQAEHELGMDPAFAALVYDTAREEGLEPGFAFELVRCGVGVCRIQLPPDDDSVVEGPPDWIARDAPTALPPERERRMRASFRRMRGLLERCPGPEAAIAAFVEEPDVGECEY